MARVILRSVRTYIISYILYGPLSLWGEVFNDPSGKQVVIKNDISNFPLFSRKPLNICARFKLGQRPLEIGLHCKLQIL